MLEIFGTLQMSHILQFFQFFDILLVLIFSFFEEVEVFPLECFDVLFDYLILCHEKRRIVAAALLAVEPQI